MAHRQLTATGIFLPDEGEQTPSGVDAEGARPSSRAGKTNPSLHMQLADILREKINSRTWSVKSRIPSEHELMERYGLSRGTVRRAISSLVDEGLLVRRHGKGTFVAEPALSHTVESRPFSFAEALHEQGKQFVTAVIDEWVTPASADVAAELHIPPHSDVMFLRRVRSVDGEPIICQESWLNLGECPGLCDIDYETESLFDAVERCSKRQIQHSRMRYSARVAGKEHAELLHCEETAAVLLLEQTINLADRTFVEWSTTWFRPGQSVVTDAMQPR